MNAHVIEYLFWQLKKDAVWYYFPLKSEHVKPIVITPKA